MPASTTIDNAILDHFFGKATWTAPAAVYLGLSSTTPTKAGANVTEPSGGGYARFQLTAAKVDAAASSANTNNVELTFAPATADWLAGANLTHIVMYDNSAGGTFLGFGALTVAQKVLSGDTFRIPVGDFDGLLGGT